MPGICAVGTGAGVGAGGDGAAAGAVPVPADESDGVPVTSGRRGTAPGCGGGGPWEAIVRVGVGLGHGWSFGVEVVWAGGLAAAALSAGAAVWGVTPEALAALMGLWVYTGTGGIMRFGRMRIGMRL
jgi:hypothetical protein